MCKTFYRFLKVIFVQLETWKGKESMLQLQCTM